MPQRAAREKLGLSLHLAALLIVSKCSLSITRALLVLGAGGDEEVSMGVLHLAWLEN